MITFNPPLASDAVNFDQMKASTDYYLSKKFTVNEILERPNSLLINASTASNRLKIFEECSFNRLNDLNLVIRFISMINKNIKSLKAFGFINEDVNVAENLLKILDRPVSLNQELTDGISLSLLRQNVINAYLKERLFATEKEIDKIWKVYSRIRHRSLSGIVAIIDLLENELDFGRDKILKNSFLLYGNAENLRKMLQLVPQIGIAPIKDILIQRPKIAMVTAESVLQIINHIKSFGIHENRILKCLDILTLGPDTVYERLVKVTTVKEFNVLLDNPRILRLIHFHSKAQARLDYLKEIKMKCASLHILSSSTDAFEKYARDGVDRTKGKDVVFYLAKILSLDQEYVRQMLSRNLHWCHVPVLEVKSNMDYLRYKKFTVEEIRDNLILLLYPLKRIETKLSTLIQWKEENIENGAIKGATLSAISNSKLLSLTLYFIEQEFHFSGDGIWEPNKHDRKDKDDKDLQTGLPKFPVAKSHRYGMREKLEIEEMTEIN
jgi:hypothetical protein